MNSEKESKRINKGTLLMFLFIPVLVAVGVIAGSYFTSTGMTEGDTVLAIKENEEEFTVPLEEFLLNVRTENNINRYVRLEISLSTEQEESIEVIDSNLDKIRDTVIHAINTQSTDTIFEEQDGSVSLKNLLKERINQALGDEVIKDVYITNIVMQ